MPRHPSTFHLDAPPLSQVARPGGERPVPRPLLYAAVGSSSVALAALVGLVIGLVL